MCLFDFVNLIYGKLSTDDSWVQTAFIGWQDALWCRRVRVHEIYMKMENAPMTQDYFESPEVAFPVYIRWNLIYKKNTMVIQH